ncbi:MAG: hypothetical protein GY814_15525 [Gammaproteobacteria bacterium]|nr:hypothetical protein [Gammaproteobacteria bacterium]
MTIEWLRLVIEQRDDGTVVLLDDDRDTPPLATIQFDASVTAYADKEAQYTIAQTMIAAGLDCAQDLLDEGQLRLPAALPGQASRFH